MSDPAALPRTIRFGTYQCDLNAKELRRNGIKVKIPDQPFRLLAILLERPGEMVPRQELAKRLWRTDTFVGFEDSLNTAVNKLRGALNDDAENPRFIETIPRYGYRFIAPVEIESAAFPHAGASVSWPPARGERTSKAGSLVHPALGQLPLSARFVKLAAALSLALFLCLSAIYGWRHPHQHVLSASEAPLRSIAVLPFDNFSGDPGQDYFAEGMTDELITDLAQIGSLRVTSRSSVMAYKNAHKPIAEIGRELQVAAVIEGSVIRSQGSVRVDAQLIETSDDRHLWAQSFTQNEENIVGLQDDVARAIAERVEVALDPSSRARLASARPVNAQAYDAYLHGNSYLMHHSDADLLKSLDYFKQATAIDPTLAVAYAGTAQAYCYLGDYSVLPDRIVWPQAEIAARHAIDLDDSIAKAHAALAFALWRYEWNWKEAEIEFQAALKLNPNDADTHHLYGVFLAAEGNFPSAAAELDKARQIDPLSLIIRTNIGWLSYYQRDYVKAIGQYQSVLQADPNFLPAHEKLWIAYALQGETDEATRELSEVFRLDEVGAQTQIAARVQAAGDGSRFRTAALIYANSGYFTSYEKAKLFALAGDKRDALEALQKAESQRDGWLVYAGVEPSFDSLRSSPQFQRLLADVGLSTRPTRR